jgi:hypothetical protein
MVTVASPEGKGERGKPWILGEFLNIMADFPVIPITRRQKNQENNNPDKDCANSARFQLPALVDPPKQIRTSHPENKCDRH